MSTALCPLATYMQPPTVAHDTPQCVVCSQPAEHKCAMPKCGEFLCVDHARACEFCKVSEAEPLRMPALKFCGAHAEEVEDRMFICVEHMPDLEAEMARVLDAERIYEEVMA